jgi:uncharacterized protein YkwD
MRSLTLIPLVLLSACGASTVADVDNFLSDKPVTAIRTTPVGTGMATLQPSAATSDDAAFAAIMNNLRIAGGVGNISYDGRLDAAAQSYAEEMLASGRFDHEGADGSTMETRATAAGYTWTFLAENIAQGQTTQSEVVADWQASTDGHRENNLDPRAEDFGIGVAGAGSETRWVLMLGAE